MPLIFPPHDKPRDHLCVPDDHRMPGDNFRRFKALGKYIVDKQPEVIVFLGDSADMASLCSYDKGKKEMVFKNVKADIEAFHEGEEYIFGPLIALNKQLAKAKKKQYQPIIIKLRGNHEYRVQRLLDYEPKWEGSVSMESFNTRLPVGEIVIPFMDFVQIDGVCYSHYFTSGVMGRPVSSAKALVTKKGVSCTMGHVHTLDSAVLNKPTGEMIRGLIAGAFHDPDHLSFGGPQVDAIWWSGLIHKHNVFNGDYDSEEISVDRLLNMY